MNSGLNFGQVFESGKNAVSNRGIDLQSKLSELEGKKELGPEDLLPLQFQMGQYSALIEAASSITKGITETLKSVSSRTG